LLANDATEHCRGVKDWGVLSEKSDSRKYRPDAVLRGSKTPGVMGFAASAGRRGGQCALAATRVVRGLLASARTVAACVDQARQAHGIRADKKTAAHIRGGWRRRFMRVSSTRRCH
jgi:hypothetical protein